MSDNREWLDSLKVGDEVAILYGGWGGNNYWFLPIGHATPTQIHVNGNKYRRSDGRRMGERYGSSIEPATPELKAEVEAAQLHNQRANRLSDIRWKQQSSETLAAICAILDAAKELE